MRSTIPAHMDKPILAVVALACAVAGDRLGPLGPVPAEGGVRLEAETGADSDATVLARSQFRKELHTPRVSTVIGLARSPWRSPTATTPTCSSPSSWCRRRWRWCTDATSSARPGSSRTGPPSSGRPRRSSPRRSWRRSGGPSGWRPTTCPRCPATRSAGATSPAPACSPATSTTSTRCRRPQLAAVIGDVTGHGIEPSITAFQAKDLLRVFLARVPRPGPGRSRCSTSGCRRCTPGPRSSCRSSSSCSTSRPGTLRYASAGHPPAGCGTTATSTR